MRSSIDGELDLVLAKRRSGEARGTLVWRDRLAWIGGPGLELDPQAPLPLILYAPPSLTRAVALETLERAGRAWRVVCTSGSLAACVPRRWRAWASRCMRAA